MGTIKEENPAVEVGTIKTALPTPGKAYLYAERPTIGAPPQAALLNCQLSTVHCQLNIRGVDKIYFLW